MTISSAGIGSGLDVNSIVTQLMAIEQQPLTALQTKATAIQTTVSEYGKIKSAVSTLRDLASKLASATTWGQTITNSSSTAVSATTNNSAAGSYTVEGPGAGQRPDDRHRHRRAGDDDAGRRHAPHRARQLQRRADQLHAEGRRHRGRHRRGGDRHARHRCATRSTPRAPA
jgi:hypothetical protein